MFIIHLLINVIALLGALLAWLMVYVHLVRQVILELLYLICAIFVIQAITKFLLQLKYAKLVFLIVMYVVIVLSVQLVVQAMF